MSNVVDLGVIPAGSMLVKNEQGTEIAVIPFRRGHHEVQHFAGLMLDKLNTPKNVAKGSWEGLDMAYLRKRLADERQEVDEALDAFERGELPATEVLGELADEGNFLMMIGKKVLIEREE